METAFIKEIFTSVQGEGFFIGEKQIFIRFCGCNLKCDYCDTNFEKENNFFVYGLEKTFNNPINATSLAQIANSFDTETISLTGGEPLLHKDFLLDFFPKLINKKIYLETNGILYKELEEIINFVDVVSMDIKLSCSTKQPNQFEANKNFIKIAKEHKKDIFVKIILNKNYSKEEILSTINILKEFDVPLIIQPMDCKDESLELNKDKLIELFDFTLKHYKNTRLIPQVHKFLNLL